MSYQEVDILSPLENAPILNPLKLMKLTEVNSSIPVVLLCFRADCSELHLNVLLMKGLVTGSFSIV